MSSPGARLPALAAVLVLLTAAPGFALDRLSQPLELAESVVQGVPQNMKVKPIGMLVWLPSSTIIELAATVPVAAEMDE